MASPRRAENGLIQAVASSGCSYRLRSTKAEFRRLPVVLIELLKMALPPSRSQFSTLGLFARSQVHEQCS